MVGLVISFIVLILLAVFFIWLATRAWRIRFAVLRWFAMILSGLLALIFGVVIVLAGVGLARFNAPPYTYSYTPAAIPITGSQDQIARGQEIAYACAGCHSANDNLPLDGSGSDFLAGGPPLGSIYPPNLTPSGPLKTWTDAQIIRAIREGVNAQGQALIIMPSDAFHAMSDADVEAVVAYLRSQPPSTRAVPLPSFNILAYAVLGAGLFPTSAQPPITGPVTAPPRAATADYGHYLASSMGCTSCHGVDFTGGANAGGGPVSPNLGNIVPKWSQTDFLTFFQTGVAPGGVKIDPNNMPWNDYAKVFSIQDLQALYMYLKTLPGK